ncbi:MAG: Anti-sigma-factor antagonist and glycosyl transferase [Pedosphaera sp.]|nr:Anti-sigma-factor antagonist and glycosyl transferase [Pedosphaera sp.]
MNTTATAPAPQSHPGIAILGVPFDNVATEEAIALVERMVASRRPHYFVTANVDFLTQARTDVELRRILLEAHLVLCDGTPLVWASRWLGNPLPQRVAGSDLVPLLIKLAAEKNLRLFFLGGTPESMDRAIANLKAEHPQLAVAGYSPPFNQLLEMDHEEIKRRIAEARPDLLFVSFGCPKQEKWIAMHYQSLGVPVAAGVGGTIDFLAGQLKRAPLWMQRTGTEWLFRLCQEPRRLYRRYFRDLRVFAGAILAQWWRMQFRGFKSKPGHVQTPLKSGSTADWRWVELPERLDLAAVQHEAQLSGLVPDDDRHCLLPMKHVEFIDSTGVGWLIRLQKQFHARDRQLILLNPHPAVKRALSLMRLDEYFVCAEDLAIARKLIKSRTLEQHELVRERPGRSPGSLGWRGEITAVNAEPVWQQTELRLAANGAAERQWVIDLSDVRFMDSTGVGVMVRARNFAQREGLQLNFTGAQPAVRNVLRLARLEASLLGDAA